MSTLIASVLDQAVESPLLATAAILGVGFALAGAAVLYETYREGRAAGVTTARAIEAARLREDAFTPERRVRLQLLQGGRADRRAS